MEAIRLFISYSHKDERYRLALESHLSILKRKGIISAWHDRKITAGSSWAKEIDQSIKSSEIILLLISSDFLSSEYCYEKELEIAMHQHETQESIVIPVIIRSSDWSDTPFATLQALPKDAEPISKWQDEDEAWLNVIDGIKLKISEIKLQKSRVNESHDFHEIKTLLKERVYAIDKAFRELDEKNCRGISTGISTLDYHIDGIPRVGLTVIAARPEMGQSQLSLQVAAHAITSERMPVAFFSLDSPAEKVTQRLIRYFSSISSDKLARGYLTEHDWPKLSLAIAKLKDAPIHIDDSMSLNCNQIKKRCIDAIEQKDVGLIVIDGFQRLIFNEEKGGRIKSVDSISKELSEFSRANGVSIILTCNLERDIEKRLEKRPYITDLHFLGCLCDDATAIFFLYRDEVYNFDSPDRGVTEIIIAKNDQLEVSGTVRVSFDAESGRFGELT